MNQNKKEGSKMNLDILTQKFTSARFLIVIMMTSTFCIITFKGLVKPEAFITIYSVAIGFYFAKNRPQENGNGNKPNV